MPSAIYNAEIDFNLDQRENGMGRDVSLSGGKVNFKFTLYRHGKPSGVPVFPYPLRENPGPERGHSVLSLVHPR